MDRQLVAVVVGHRWTFAALVAAAVSYPALPGGLSLLTRATIAWDIGVAVLLALAAWGFATGGDDNAMARNARRQQEGEWTIFAVILAVTAVSFAALTKVLASAKDMPPKQRNLYVLLVATTLVLSWMLTHIVFAMRYAHEYYSRSGDVGAVDGNPVDGGLGFPGEEPPDYWDFVYFALVLGMTFQVSDVEITSRKLRRLATLHGLLSFLFNTVIVALTVNIAASLL